MPNMEIAHLKSIPPNIKGLVAINFWVCMTLQSLDSVTASLHSPNSRSVQADS